DRVGPHGQPADGARFPSLVAEEIEEDASGELRPASMEGGGAAIDVVIALQSGRKREFSQTKGVGGQQVDQFVAFRFGHLSQEWLSEFCVAQALLPVPVSFQEPGRAGAGVPGTRWCCAFRGGGALACGECTIGERRGRGRPRSQFFERGAGSACATKSYSF